MKVPGLSLKKKYLSINCRVSEQYIDLEIIVFPDPRTSSHGMVIGLDSQNGVGVGYSDSIWRGFWGG